MGVCTASLLAVPELAIAKRENVLQQAALKSVVLDICRIYFAYEMRLRGGIIGNSACIVGYKASFLSLLIELLTTTATNKQTSKKQKKTQNTKKLKTSSCVPVTWVFLPVPGTWYLLVQIIIIYFPCLLLHRINVNNIILMKQK